ncbi:histidine phosphatase family protein [Zavarzinia sp. CC-PAN008]|uniref:histidine phosphatase family protein n=1 Tax=Zavarzinia sp. CC-PAN008 TaxID=3243332 RepID=UPI003F747604
MSHDGHAIDGTVVRRRIYLMRHAEAAYVDESGRRALDSRAVPLTARGRDQAAAAHDLLRDVTFDRAWCSGLPRTRETAGIVLGGRSLALEVEPELEELKAGSFGAIAQEQFAEEFRHGLLRAHDDEARFLGGERFVDFEARVVPAFNRLLLTPGWSTLLLVAHGGVNRMVLGWATGGNRQAFGAFEQDSGCVNVLDIDIDLSRGSVERRLIRLVNLTPYNLTKAGLLLTTMEALLHELESAKG